jgi:hypothetical protein
VRRLCDARLPRLRLRATVRARPLVRQQG